MTVSVRNIVLLALMLLFAGLAALLVQGAVTATLYCSEVQ